MSALAVTHTGQPGPESISTVGGRSWRIPFLMIETVCPPQNSINLVGLVDSCFILDTSFLASSTSRYSSMNFTILCFPPVVVRYPVALWLAATMPAQLPPDYLPNLQERLNI